MISIALFGFTRGLRPPMYLMASLPAVLISDDDEDMVVLTCVQSMLEFLKFLNKFFNFCYEPGLEFRELGEKSVIKSRQIRPCKALHLFNSFNSIGLSHDSDDLRTE